MHERVRTREEPHRTRLLCLRRGRAIRVIRTGVRRCAGPACQPEKQSRAKGYEQDGGRGSAVTRTDTAAGCSGSVEMAETRRETRDGKRKQTVCRRRQQRVTDSGGLNVGDGCAKSSQGGNGSAELRGGNLEPRPSTQDRSPSAGKAKCKCVPRCLLALKVVDSRPPPCNGQPRATTLQHACVFIVMHTHSRHQPVQFQPVAGHAASLTTYKASRSSYFREALGSVVILHRPARAAVGNAISTFRVVFGRRLQAQKWLDGFASSGGGP